jgi:hypothetical protein
MSSATAVPAACRSSVLRETTGSITTCFRAIGVPWDSPNNKRAGPGLTAPQAHPGLGRTGRGCRCYWPDAWRTEHPCPQRLLHELVRRAAGRKGRLRVPPNRIGTRRKRGASGKRSVVIRPDSERCAGASPTDLQDRTRQVTLSSLEWTLAGAAGRLNAPPPEDMWLCVKELRCSLRRWSGSCLEPWVQGGGMWCLPSHLQQGRRPILTPNREDAPGGAAISSTRNERKVECQDREFWPRPAGW